MKGSRRARSERWAQVLQSRPRVVNLPRFGQTEAAAVAADGRALYVGSEGDPPAFARVPLPTS